MIKIAPLLLLLSLSAPGTEPGRRVPAGTPARLEASVARLPLQPQLMVALPPLPEGVEELPFADFFELPVGPRGLEPSARLRSLEGRQVRLTGYVVFEDWGTCSCAPDATPTRRGPAWMQHVVPGRLLLAPVPTTVSLGHYGPCDDLPPQTAYLQITDRFGEPVFFRPGLHSVIGTLQLGSRTEPDGRVSYVHLVVPQEGALQRAGSSVISAR